MNFDITRDSDLGSAIFLALLLFGAAILVVSIVTGLWRTRRGAPMIDQDDNVER
jgi:hypothetical protein